MAGVLEQRTCKKPLLGFRLPKQMPLGNKTFLFPGPSGKVVWACRPWWSGGLMLWMTAQSSELMDQWSPCIPMGRWLLATCLGWTGGYCCLEPQTQDVVVMLAPAMLDTRLGSGCQGRAFQEGATSLWGTCGGLLISVLSPLWPVKKGSLSVLSVSTMPGKGFRISHPRICQFIILF